jgi:hypothetical protein
VATLAELQAYAVQAAENASVPPSLFLWQIGQESSWNASAQNGNATGIAQFMPGTAAQFGIDPTNPYQSLTAAAQYDAQLYNQTGSWTGALTKYGTLANVPSSVMASFNNVLSNLGLSSNNTNSTGTTGTGSSATTTDNFFTKVAVVILGIVVIGAALYMFGKSIRPLTG